MTRPKLLILDEPTEGIQPNIVQQIETALTRVRQELYPVTLIGLHGGIKNHHIFQHFIEATCKPTYVTQNRENGKLGEWKPRAKSNRSASLKTF